ncbi:gas vesicle protein [Nonomuraea sp. NPDC048916]|uniref:gas vesicle protein GvpO n=1 Tax=Nonomuraea sp. NPDC048916 TaxID=3154232 RepID=UPI0033F813E2
MPVRHGTKHDDRTDDHVEEEDVEEEDVEEADVEEADVEEEDAEEPRKRSRELSAADAGAVGLSQISKLTGKDAEGVTLVEPTDDGWLVGVEIVEDRRIPSSGDILALYEAEFDMEGDLLAYRRVRRYKRGSSDVGEGAQ